MGTVIVIIQSASQHAKESDFTLCLDKRQYLVPCGKIPDNKDCLLGAVDKSHQGTYYKKEGNDSEIHFLYEIKDQNTPQYEGACGQEDVDVLVLGIASSL